MPITRLLERVRLPVKMLEVPDLYVDESRFCLLLKKEFGPDFGFMIGQRIRYDKLGSFGTTLVQQPSLNEALQTFCFLARREAFGVEFALHWIDESCWFLMDPRKILEIGWETMELYDLQLMVKLVQSAAGGSWKPPSVKLRAKTLVSGLRPDDISAGPIQFGSLVTGIAIQTNLLLQRMSGYRPTSQGSSHGNNTPSSFQTPDFQAFIRLLMKGYLDEKFSLHDLADLIGLSYRTLQRRLAENDTSFSALLEQCRFESSKDLIDQNALSLSEIGFELGYSDVAHFSRAFKRWSGMSPRQYRDLCILKNTPYGQKTPTLC